MNNPPCWESNNTYKKILLEKMTKRYIYFDYNIFSNKIIINAE